jgi:hypothetical protein
MAERPYLSLSADELQAEARKHWDSATFLAGVLDELSHRTTAKAQRLEREVRERLEALSGTAAPGTDESRSGRTSRGHGSDAFRLEQQLREAREQLKDAEAEVTRLRQATMDPVAALFAQVGLHPSCPDFLVRAAHRAFRKEFHPDALSDRPRPEQLAAQERFKEIEGIFVEVHRTREGK